MFDFDNDGTSKFYFLCAVIVKNAELSQMEESMQRVKNDNGFGNTEMKSSAVGSNYRRRSKIISELLPIPFRVILFVADKQAFKQNSPLSTYRQTFIKYLLQGINRIKSSWAVFYKFKKCQTIRLSGSAEKYCTFFKAFRGKTDERSF